MNKTKITTSRLLSKAQIASYHEDGFIIVPGLFDPEEIEPLRQACEANPTIGGNCALVGDLKGRKYGAAFWSELNDNTLLSILPRTARVVDAVEMLQETDCYHWHSKILVKPAKDEAHVPWHQEFGFWYYDGCLFPKVVTCTIAINRNNRENGCLKVIRQSHLLGRIDLITAGGSKYADPVRVERALEKLEVVYCELEAGDALFFHANTLHSSEGNHSNSSRMLMHSAFNAVSNAPYIVEGQEHHQYKPLEKLPDSLIKEGRYASVFKNQKFWIWTKKYPVDL